MNERGEDRDTTRRSFLVETAGKLSGAMFVAVSGSAVAGAEMMCGGLRLVEADQDGGDAYDPHKHRYAYVVDINKCIGCGSCVRACERENNVPPDHFRTWVERYTVSSGGDVEIDSPNGARDGFDRKVTDRDVSKAFFVPKLCNHCTETPCVQLCPVGASYRTPDGVILVDEKRCIGCGYCVQACPYGSRFLHPVTHTASKCTFCYHRITKGLKPACVHVCPTGARKFGDLEQPGDEVAEIIAKEKVQVLKPELHTQPNCFYVGSSREVR